MSRIENENIVLTAVETKNLLNALLRPDQSIIDKRNKFWNEIDEMDITDIEDGISIIEIPGLDDILASRIVNTTFAVDMKVEAIYESAKMSEVKINTCQISTIYGEENDDRYGRVVEANLYQDTYGYNNAVA